MRVKYSMSVECGLNLGSRLRNGDCRYGGVVRSAALRGPRRARHVAGKFSFDRCMLAVCGWVGVGEREREQASALGGWVGCAKDLGWLSGFHELESLPPTSYSGAEFGSDSPQLVMRSGFFLEGS